MEENKINGESLPFIHINEEQFINKLMFVISRTDSNFSNIEIYYNNINKDLFKKFKNDLQLKVTDECPENHFIIRKIKENELFVYNIIFEKEDTNFIKSDIYLCFLELNKIVAAKRPLFEFHTDGNTECIYFMDSKIFSSYDFKMDFTNDNTIKDMVLRQCINKLNVIKNNADKVLTGVKLEPH